MKLKDILSPSFTDYLKPIKPMVEVEWDSDLCQEVVCKGWLSEKQIRHAAARYRLGKSKSGKTIYWMIDEMNRVRDGHLGDTWVSSLLKNRESQFLQWWHPRHCLFGLHLLCPAESAEKADLEAPANRGTAIMQGDKNLSAVSAISSTKDRSVALQSAGPQKNISVVESEASAAILSELFPESIWMAYAYPANMTVDLLEPLQGCTVTIYPQTDPDMEIYLSFFDFADTVRRIYPSIDITIERILEDNATEEQKQRNIDLVDFLFESHTEITDINE